jgi:hypothetical protein
MPSSKTAFKILLRDTWRETNRFKGGPMKRASWNPLVSIQVYLRNLLLRDTWRETKRFQGGPHVSGILEPSGFYPGISQSELLELGDRFTELE